MIRITETVKHLIIINIVFWIGTLTIGEYGAVFDSWFAMHFPLNDDFKPWQVITHMFMHASYVNTAGGVSIFFFHILFNLLGIWMFGSAVENSLGRKKFLFLYFSAGLGATLLPLIIDYFNFTSIMSQLGDNGFTTDEIVALLNERKLNFNAVSSIIGVENSETLRSIFFTKSLGASGAVMGILVAFGMLFPNAQLMLIFLPIPIKAKYFIPLVLGYEIISGVIGGSSMFGFNVGHFAHIGGAIVGFITMWYWKKNQFNKHRWD